MKSLKIIGFLAAASLLIALPASADLEVRAPGYAPSSERIYVLPGKTMHVDAELWSAPQS